MAEVISFASAFASIILFIQMLAITIRFRAIVGANRKRLEEIGFLGRHINMPIRATMGCIASIMCWSLFSGVAVLVSIHQNAPFNWLTIPILFSKIAFYMAVGQWSTQLFENVERRLGE